MHKFLVISGLVAASATPYLAFAQANAPASPHTFTGNVGFFSEYRFRGISQTYGKPAIQGGFDYAHSSGLYAGTWGSNVSSSTYTNGSMEWDFYGGYKNKIGSTDIGYDVGLLYYYYPGAEYNIASKDKYDNLEIYAGLSYKWFSFKYYHTLSDFFGVNTNTYGGSCGIDRSGVAYTAATAPDGCIGATPGNSKGSGYFDASFTYEFADKWFVGAHIGRQTVRHYSQLSYTDYKVSINKEYSGFNFGVAYITTNAKEPFYTGTKTIGGGSLTTRDISDSTIVLSVTKSF